MTAVTTVERESEQTTRGPKMWHIVHPWSDWTRSMCGKERGNAPVYPGTTGVDCVVCADLWNRWCEGL